MAETGKAKIVLYGSYGYTGHLIAELAAANGIPLILSGRNEEKVKALAERTGHEYEAASLGDSVALDALLNRASVVLHAAGPFVDTYSAMASACLRTETHYLDITGEIEVFEGLAKLNDKARKAGIMILPGVGFDVVPTDCMAALLKEKLPDAHELELAFKMAGGGFSHGTATTMVRSLGEHNRIRRSGRIIGVRAGKRVIIADFGKGPRKAYGIPWGDVSTAWYTTDIPNISTYVSLPPKMGSMLKFSGWFGRLLRSRWIRKIAQNRVDKAPAGPDAATRKKSQTKVWGRVRNMEGQEVVHRFSCPEGYNLTAAASLHIAQRVVKDDFKIGFQTPAGCFGPELLDEVVKEMEAQS